MKYLKLFEDFRRRTTEGDKDLFTTGWEGRDYVTDPDTGREKFVVPPDEVEKVVQRYIKFAGPRSPYIQKIVNTTMKRLLTVSGAEMINGKVFIPFSVKRKDTSEFSQVRQDIEAELNKHGLTILDYNLGLTTAPAEIKKHKRDIEKGDYTRVTKFKIGKILNKYKAFALMKEFENDPVRQGKSTKYYLAFSANPRDLVRQSTARGWKSCMNLFGNNENGKEFIQYDILNGSIAVYVTKKKDPNLNSVTGRITLKLFFGIGSNSEKWTYGIATSYYGNALDTELVDKFTVLLNGIVKDKIQFENFGNYELVQTLYCDYGNTIFVSPNNKKLKQLPPEQRIKKLCDLYGIKNYTINEDYSIDVKGGVILNNKNLTKLPLKFNKVTGNFEARNNKLTSLEGAPKEVGWDFDCSDNDLTSLKGGPQKVKGKFICAQNNLTSLEGVPQTVTGDFVCSYNNLTSLEGAPEKVTGHFNCSTNYLTSLKGAPRTIDGDFGCIANVLTNLEGAPEIVDGDFNFQYNVLTSLKGAPEKVGGDFEVRNNKLTSLDGAPKEVGGHFDCSECNLTSLEGAPKEVIGIFRCSRNRLTSLEGAPEKVGGDFNCGHNNNLTSLKDAPKEVGGSFWCNDNKLTSLEGAPKEVGDNFYCKNNVKKFTEEEVRAVSKVGGNIYL